MTEQLYIVGINGVGMSALAQALLDDGCVVSGSDRLLDQGGMTRTLECLRGQGVRLFPQDGSGITSQCARVVISTAIEPDNPEVTKAKTLGIPVAHRAEELARLVVSRELVAVTGTCGKTTVTAMLGAILEGAGFDPLVINGAPVAGWDRGGERLGSVRRPVRAKDSTGDHPGWAVIEADESDRSLLCFSPRHAIITNVSADHFTLEESQHLFDLFRRRVSGQLLDDRLATDAPENMRQEGWDSFFTWQEREYHVPMPGAHNIVNAWQAVRMATALGADMDRVTSALSSFGGVQRRLQRIGVCRGAVVVDDYAHNPEKLAAAWTTLADAFPVGICAVWRPHGYAPLRKMLDALVEAFARVCRPVDTLLLLPVYDAGGTTDRSLNSNFLASLLKGRNVNVIAVEELEQAGEIMRARAAAGGALATLGARDPGLPLLARTLASH